MPHQKSIDAIETRTLDSILLKKVIPEVKAIIEPYWKTSAAIVKYTKNTGKWLFNVREGVLIIISNR